MDMALIHLRTSPARFEHCSISSVSRETLSICRDKFLHHITAGLGMENSNGRRPRIPAKA